MSLQIVGWLRDSAPLSRAGVEIEPEKSLVSDSGCFEFAKRFRIRSGEVDSPFCSNVCGACFLAGCHPGPLSGSGRASVEPGLTTPGGWLSGARLMAHPDVIGFVCG